MLKKNDLIERYAQDMEVSKKDATVAVEKVIDLIKTGIVEDGGVDLYGFGKLSVEVVPERTRKYTMGENKGQEYTTPFHIGTIRKGTISFKNKHTKCCDSFIQRNEQG